MTPLSLSDIVFPDTGGTTPSLSALLGELKRSNLSIGHRLRSIQQDSVFVEQVQACFGRRPLVANERCGSWYVQPSLKAASAYFKSTDGHSNAWKFSTRRLNLHLLDLIEKNDGCIIVDSTRRGKRMPDALSKTVPVWCTVLNRALFPHFTDFHLLFTPPNVVSVSEHDTIAALLPEFFASFQALNLDLSGLGAKLTKPLRPLWVTPDSPMPMAAQDAGSLFDEYIPIICCTASRRVDDGGELGEGGYVQGAADDTENWAHGLTPDVFWHYSGQLLGATDPTLPTLISSCLLMDQKSEQEAASSQTCASVNVGPGLYVTPLPLPASSPGECRVILSPLVKAGGFAAGSENERTFGVGKQKAGSRNLRYVLPDIVRFIGTYLGSTSLQSHNHKIVVGCETGKDLSVGVALGLFCWFFSEDNKLRSNIAEAPLRMNKNLIRVKLAIIIMAFPTANLSRATLQSVNSFLMGGTESLVN